MAAAATIKITGLKMIIAGILLVSVVQEALTFSIGTGSNSFINTLASGSDYGNPNPTNDYGNKDTYQAETTLKCGADALECVPKADCEENPLKGTRQCPPMWRKIGGACYFVPNPARVRLRSQPEARQYCKDIGGHLLWLENEYEKKLVDEAAQKSYWVDGVYDKKKEFWYWENNWINLVFKKLDGGKSNNNPAITSPTDQRLCLSMDNQEFTPDTCYEKKSFVCKMGTQENRCEKSLGRCCWGPSYQYYYTSLLGTSTNSLGAECFVKFNGDIITCLKAFSELKNLPTFRIEKSIYYLSSASDGCSGAREAVISNEAIHQTIVRFLMTVEKLNIKIKIGMVNKATDTGSKRLWVNGKADSFYQNEHWAVGYPKDTLSGCIMYADTGVDGSGSYLWRNVEDDAECSASKNMVLCELPIRNTDFVPEKTTQTCGLRQSGGVLGRSFSNGNDHEEARLGEFPWQVAILKPNTGYQGHGQEFACSGALLSHDVVLTSAHCVQNLHASQLQVSLGDYDLDAVNQRKLLEPILVGVLNVVVHPGYNTFDGANDIAIIYLVKPVPYADHAHINIGCLPNQQVLYAGGDWECFVTGWPTGSYYSGRKLQRVEVDLVRRHLCLRQQQQETSNSYYAQRQQPVQNTGAKKVEPMCTEPWDTNTCLPDSTNLLICKKNIVFNDDPFNLGPAEAPSSDSGHYGYGQQPISSQQASSQHGGIQSYAESITKVVNAYGANRFNAEKWYLIGVGHQSNSCRTPGYTMFTPVHKFLTFIHSLIDETS